MSDTGDRRHPITYRDPDLIRRILEFVIECEDDGNSKAGFVEIIAEFSNGPQSATTLEHMLYELQAFGALRRTGRYKPNDDTRCLVITALGQHWLRGTQPEPLGGST